MTILKSTTFCGAAVVIAAQALVAHAETNPYSLSADVSMNHDSNVFRTADNVISDTTRRGGLTASIDQPVGLQRVYAAATVGYEQHVTLSRLNNTPYSFNGGLDWATRGHLSGTLRYATSRSLADYGVANAPVTEDKNLQHSQLLSLSALYALHSRLSLELSAEHRSLDYSAAAYRPLAYWEDTLGTGFRFGASGPIIASIGGRYTRGTTPNFQVGPDEFEADRLRRTDADLSLTWRTSKIGLTGRLSHSRETHTQPTYPGFSGPTWAIDLDYAPSSKVNLQAGVSRDTGSATTFFNFVPTAAPIRVDTNQLATAAHASATYAYSSRIAFSGQATYNRGDTTSLFQATQDRVASYVVGVQYQPREFLKLSCSVDRESRRSLTPGLSSDATIVGCLLQGSVR